MSKVQSGTLIISAFKYNIFPWKTNEGTGRLTLILLKFYEIYSEIRNVASENYDYVISSNDGSINIFFPRNNLGNFLGL